MVPVAMYRGGAAALSDDAGAIIDATVRLHDANYHLMLFDFGGAIFVPQREIAGGKRLRVTSALCAGSGAIP